MKKIIYLIIPIFLAGCSNDFINLLPQSTVTIDLLYQTDKDFQDAVVGGYAVLQSQYQNMFVYGDIRADDAEVEMLKSDAWSEAERFVMSATTGSISTTWRNYFTLISRVNLVLEKIEGVDPAVVRNKSRHIAEAKFLRALAYFDLVRIYGDVPLLTVPITANEALKTPRTNVNAVYELIVSDLQDCEMDLPTSYSGSDVGRATRGAAKSLLGKVYLTRSDFAKAESKLQEVTIMGYSLLPDYNRLWDYTKDEHHSEYIFDIEYASGNNISNGLSNNFVPNDTEFLRFHGIVGSSYEALAVSDELRALFDDHDTRKDVTVGLKGGWINGAGAFVIIPVGKNQTYTKKYIASMPSERDSPANWKVIRYADVLLMYAEALNENGKTGEALTYLNMVRTRAGVYTYSGLSQSDTREAIYKERRLELSYEGHRWFDLVRTGRAYETMKDKGMRPYMILYPIPWSQIQIVNDPTILWQNEGY